MGCCRVGSSLAMAMQKRGHDVAVIDRAPAQPAPIVMPSAAISSSACKTAKLALPLSLSTRYFRR